MITYQRLWETMKKRGITQYHLIKREKFSAGQIGRLKNNQTVSTQTLDTLCRLLSCRIEDIVTYIPDGGEHLPDPEPDQTSPLPSKKVTKSEKPDKSDKTEKALEENSTEDQLNKLQKKIDNLSYKRKKLLDNYLSGIVEKDIYEETDVNLKTDLSNTKAKLVYFQQQADEEGSLQRRIADFKKALSQNEVLEEFDRGIFESIIEKVIVGGYDEYGEKDPYKITFIYKTGFKNEIGNAKKRFGKSAGVVDKAKKMCSDVSDKVKDVYSNVSDNTC